jgi:hypothetical protein
MAAAVATILGLEEAELLALASSSRSVSLGTPHH